MSRLDSFSSYVEAARVSWDCPGAAVAVVRGDDVLYREVFGHQDVENQIPVTQDTRFAMASVTKSFIAMAVALLVDEGKLEWDKPVREYMPEFILDDAYATQHVTIRDMLCHRTGMPRHDLSAWRRDIPLADFVKGMKHFKFSASFREKFQYNNLMYYATGYLIEKLSGQPFDQFVQQRIFGPLGMTASNFQPEPPLPGQETAWGYRIDRDDEGRLKQLVRTEHGKFTQLSPGAAGALFSTMADLTQWLKVHVNQGRIGETQFVSPNNLQQMHLPQMVIPGGGISEALTGNTIFNYGLGWFVEPYRGYTLVHHGGNLEGYSLIIGFVPAEKLGVVGLTNIGMMPLRDVILYEAIDRALDLPDRDWNARYHGLFDPIIVGMARGKQTAAAERIADASPTHALDAYVGVYAADGYPDVAVRREGDGLQASLVNSMDWSTLRHYHYDLFEWHHVDFDNWAKVSFVVNENGEIDAVSVPIEPEVDNVVFKRKPLVLPQDVIDALIGVYEPPVDGMLITVTSRDGKVYLTVQGGTPDEIKPYKLDESIVGLALKRTRFDFVREQNQITCLVMKSPGMTLEAPRKG
ncbi:MAG: serine hydrolase [Chloroflexi bacterium]|nr:serine hydrolase [Chloroflexota bacterium]